MACSYRSITLQPGETAVLPSNAVIKAVSPNSDLLKSANNCAKFDDLETLQCYTCVIGLAGEDGDASQTWEIDPTSGDGGGSVYLKGITFKTSLETVSTEYLFTDYAYTFLIYSGLLASGSSSGAFLKLESEILSLVGSQGIVGVKVSQAADPERWYNLYVTILTIPSVAINLSIHVESNSGGMQNAFFNFRPTADIVSAAYNSFVSPSFCPSIS